MPGRSVDWCMNYHDWMKTRTITVSANSTLLYKHKNPNPNPWVVGWAVFGVWCLCSCYVVRLFMLFIHVVCSCCLFMLFAHGVCSCCLVHGCVWLSFFVSGFVSSLVGMRALLQLFLFDVFPLVFVSTLCSCFFFSSYYWLVFMLLLVIMSTVIVFLHLQLVGFVLFCLLLLLVYFLGGPLHSFLRFTLAL